MSKFNLRRTRSTALAAAALAALATAAPASANPIATASSASGVHPAVAIGAIANTTGNEDMIQTPAGNLYWTADTGTACAPICQASIYRALKTGTPGQENLLYTQKSTTPIEFGGLTYALDNGTYYLYVVVNNPTAKTSQIEQVNLGGATSAASVISAPSYIGNDDLITDGKALYWASAGGIKRLVIGSTTIQKLGSSTSTSRLRIVGNRLYYSDGDNVDVTNTTGGTVTTLLSDNVPITALDVVATAHAGTEVAIGDAVGSDYDETGEMSAPTWFGYSPNATPTTSISIDPTTGNVGMVLDGASSSTIDDWSIDPSTGLVTAQPVEWAAAASGAKSLQNDDANAYGYGDFLYYETPSSIDKLGA